MTAATLTRGARSAYPTAVDELIPLAREYAAELQRPPSQNELTKRFKVGKPKARAVLAALAPAPTEQPSPAPDAPVQDVPPAVLPPAPAASPAEPDRPADQPGQLVVTDTRGPEIAEVAEVISQVRATEIPAPAAETARDDKPPVHASRFSRYGMATLLTVVGVLLAGVIVAPIALSSQDIISWAKSPTGLGLTGVWPLVTFFALDAAAAVCVGLVVYCAWRGEGAGVFAWLVWAFAGMSAYANYSHSSGSPARDAVWFFPAMSLAGPFLLEIIVRRVRRWVQEGTGQRTRHSVSFGFGRWIPGVGALRETYGAWRLARLDGIDDADRAVREYRRLCPDGSIRVLRALRERGK